MGGCTLQTLWAFSILVLTLSNIGAADTIVRYDFEEEQGSNVRIGFINESLGPDYQPPYTVMASIPGALQFDLNTGEVRTKENIDREKLIDYKLEFFALSSNRIALRVEIYIIDINDNSPVFNISKNVSFSESANNGTSVFLGSVTDSDSSQYSVKSYAVVPGSADGLFALKSGKINNNVGYLELQLLGKLDYETVKSYKVNITAEDGGSPPRMSSIMFDVYVQDANDQAPRFELSIYSANIPENAPNGQSVVKVEAYDLDSGKNAQITYSINPSSDPAGHFAIDPDSGLVSVNRPLDYEQKSSYMLSVVATDGGLPPQSDTASINVTIINISEQPAAIKVDFLTTSPAHIVENTAVNLSVARISVSDPDTDSVIQNVNMTVQGGLQGSVNYFGLRTDDNTNYYLFLTASPDRELVSNFSLSILAVDLTGRSPLQATKSFTIWIDDVNDNKPTFQKTLYSAEVQETDPPGTSILQVSATDADTGPNAQITYGIYSQANNSDWFEIDPATGWLLVRSSDVIDCEENSNPWITILARDSGNPSLTGSTTVSLTIKDVNDMQPTFPQTYYPVVVPENKAVGSCILKVSADDQDCNGNKNLRYFLSEATLQSIPYFELNAETGDLCIKKSLDYEVEQSFQFPVYARDIGNLTGDSMVGVTVEDVNDNYPVFYPSNYSQNINVQEAQASRDIVTVQAQDRDSGTFGIVEYQIVSGDVNGAFVVNAKTGLVSLAKSLPPEEKVYVITITAQDGGKLTSKSPATVFVSVLGNNYVPPTFTNATYSFSVSEDVAEDTLVGQVTAQSSGDNPQAISYEISSGDRDNNFIIDTNTGKIYTKTPLDHELRPFILLNVKAKYSNPPVFGTTQVNVTILDVNDNAPKFTTSSVDIHVWEDELLTTVIYKAVASDSDSGKNGTVNYRLSVNPGSTFQINQEMGSVTLTKSLDYEDVQMYVVIITAFDLGTAVTLSTNMTLNIYVSNRNDNSPQFNTTSYMADVLESASLQTSVMQVTATDADNDQITYSIQDTGEYFNAFRIDPTKGIIRVKQALDRERRSSYTLEVIAKDNGKPDSRSARATVHIMVTDVNDNAPEFFPDWYIFEISEGEAANSLVGTVSASDKDQGQNAKLRYSIVEQTGFTIDGTTGQVRTNHVLDREVQSSYKFWVTAEDQAPVASDRLSASCHVVVNILDVNDNSPQIIKPGEGPIVGQVRENKVKGTQVVQIAAFDTDLGENGTIAYGFVIDGVETQNTGDFLIDSQTGWITTAEVLDYERKQEYSFIVRVKDHGNPQRLSSVSVVVKVIDDASEGEITNAKNITINVVENTPIGTVIGQVLLYDNAPNTRVRYQAYTGNVFGLFVVNYTTGDIYLVKDIDYEESSWHQIGIYAVDESKPFPGSQTIRVDINVIDVNDNYPEFPQNPLEIRRPENLPIGHVTYTFTATDRDQGSNGTVAYSLNAHSLASDYFDLDPNTGALKIKKKFDYEVIKSISLVVFAQDQSSVLGHRLKSSVYVTIHIDDLNDNPPIFENYQSFKVREDVPVGHVITLVLATDRDSFVNQTGPGAVIYRITSGNEGDSFSLDETTGLLTVAQLLDREKKDIYNLNVTATDLGMPFHVVSILIGIIVEDVNDHKPLFSQSEYNVKVTENNPNSQQQLLVLSARDDDADDNRKLRYGLPSTGSDMFTVDENTGAFSLRGVLDREQKSLHSITVFVEDQGQPMNFDTATVTVDVQDENDYSPTFPSPQVTLKIPENMAQQAFYTVVAMDMDAEENARLSYTIVDGNSAGHFSLESTSGKLSCVSLDREKIPNYTLRVQARDMGQSPRSSDLTIQIQVIDENDNTPVFISSSYSTQIREDVAIGTTILRLSASDPDLGENGQITYSLGNDTEGMFTVDNKTGNISTSGIFDCEKKSVYEFYLWAEDNGQYNRRRISTKVTVTITNINDNAPRFLNQPYVKQIASGTGADSFVVKIMATDADNPTLTYILDGSPPFFKMDQATGEIYTKQQLTSEANGYHYLKVIAKDMDPTSPLQTTSMVTIKVGSESHSHLEFTELTYSSQVDEHDIPGRVVTTVIATGASVLSYSIVEGNQDNLFSIDINGDIKVQNQTALDYEKFHQVELLIEARSGDLLGYALVLINIRDINDNPPSFVQKTYFASVQEDVKMNTWVAQVIATDLDSGNNQQLEYSFRRDEEKAFDIDSKGNIYNRLPLDFEVHSSYVLTIEAVDKGSIPRTGTCTLVISVVDVNDQSPNFPNVLPVAIIPENAAVGEIVTELTATDVDKYPPLLYSFMSEREVEGRFAINKFTGEITLLSPLDHEMMSVFNLRLKVTDGREVAYANQTVSVTDINDNPPQFLKAGYNVSVNEGTSPGEEIYRISARDPDSGDNAKILFSFVEASDNFSIDAETGAVRAKEEIVFIPTLQTIRLTVLAHNPGNPTLSSAVFFYITVRQVNVHAPVFLNNSYETSVKENSRLGYLVTQVSARDQDTNQQVSYSFTSGSGHFYIEADSGKIFVNRPIDRERFPTFLLGVSAVDNVQPYKSAIVTVKITVLDVNDNPPTFELSKYSKNVYENFTSGASIMQVLASDADEPSEMAYSIVSGNDVDLFSINSDTGVIRLKSDRKLAYESQVSHKLVIQAVDCVSCQSDQPQLTSFTTVVINVLDCDEFSPFFPVPMYYAVFPENSPPGSNVFQARAVDEDKGPFGDLSYEISSNPFFTIDSTTGWVRSADGIEFDAENLPAGMAPSGTITISITARDFMGSTAQVSAVIKIQDIDEYFPKFAKNEYDFEVPGNAGVGRIMGRVLATDLDSGSAGNVYYFLTHVNDYFGVNVTTGEVYVKLGFNSNPRRRRSLDYNGHRSKRALESNKVNLIIEAKSAEVNFKSSSASVMVAVDESCDGCSLLGKSSSDGSSGVMVAVAVAVPIVLVIIAVVIGIFVFLRCRNKKNKEPAADFREIQEYDNQVSQMAYNFSDMPAYNQGKPVANNNNSDLSEASHHSMSSGRGSVEAEEDEEICMINDLATDLNQSNGYRSKNMPDSGIQDDESASEPSAQNSKDYLAKLGIDSHIPTKAKNYSGNGDTSSSIAEVSLDTSIEQSDISPKVGSYPYHKDQGFHEPDFKHGGITSNVTNSEEEYSGSYNWDYLLDWGPQYQPLADVFSEIARLKDDNVQPKKRPIQQVPQSNISSSLKPPPVKMIPPPIITNAPPQGTQSSGSRRSSQSSGGSGNKSTPRATNVSNNIKNVALHHARSPITNNDSGFTAPLTPSFTPSLSPLATRGPSVGDTNHAHQGGAPHPNSHHSPHYHQNHFQHHPYHNGHRHANHPPLHNGRGHSGQLEDRQASVHAGVILNPYMEEEQELRI